MLKIHILQLLHNLLEYISDGTGSRTRYRISVVSGVFIGIGIGSFLSHFPIPKFDKITVQEMMMKLARYKKIEESYFVL